MLSRRPNKGLTVSRDLWDAMRLFVVTGCALSLTGWLVDEDRISKRAIAIFAVVAVLLVSYIVWCIAR